MPSHPPPNYNYTAWTEPVLNLIVAEKLRDIVNSCRVGIHFPRVIPTYRAGAWTTVTQADARRMLCVGRMQHLSAKQQDEHARVGPIEQDACPNAEFNAGRMVLKQYTVCLA
ncbi:hypothetical protein HG15A2_08070 [Adhaeretor mobilis]|uniref:Uncharacterized protein n=1 Tax=Adhaeretor mobilis TaxID=1930276 RepID=A0A517MRP4_9BACT|nr:hypothetical protein HG15A2_08070 [Adhaeretor mobilis]